MPVFPSARAAFPLGKLRLLAIPQTRKRAVDGFPDEPVKSGARPVDKR